jgi:hypothetical protein
VGQHRKKQCEILSIAGRRISTSRLSVPKMAHTRFELQIPSADGDGAIFEIDCSIVLKTADQKAKIVARVFSTASALGTVSMTRWQTLAFVFR